MKLDRDAIVRHDFATAKDGYDRGAVDRHLARIADAAEGDEVAAEAQERLAGIVEGAQRSADALREQAEAEAREIRESARREGEGRANAEAAERIARAETAVSSVVERAEALRLGIEEVQASVRERGEALAQALGDAAEPLVKTLEERASALSAELALMGTGLAQVDELRPDQDEVDEATDAYAADEPVREESAQAEARRRFEGGAVEEEGDAEEEEEHGGSHRAGVERARLVALNMALAGTPREETERELRERFDLPDSTSILDEVYERAEQAS